MKVISSVIPRTIQFSLIVLQLPTSHAAKKCFQLIIQKKIAFGSVLAFPGGKLQEKDKLASIQYKLPSVLHATALRQCFEETGLYLSHKKLMTTQQYKLLETIKFQYLKQCFNGNISLQNSIYFNKLSQVLPPLNQLTPYLRLITMAIFKDRYDVIFYLHHLKQMEYINFLKFVQKNQWVHQTQKITMCKRQFVQYKWMTPFQILSGYFKGVLQIAPPQFIMINIMCKFWKYQNFLNYVKNLQNQSNQLLLAPNIITLIKNKNQKTSIKYPYAATLIGDYQYPYINAINSQVSQQLKQQLVKYSQINFGNQTNRLLFEKPKQFFKDNYSKDCTLKNSVLQNLLTYQQIKQELQKHYQ